MTKSGLAAVLLRLAWWREDAGTRKWRCYKLVLSLVPTQCALFFQGVLTVQGEWILNKAYRI